MTEARSSPPSAPFVRSGDVVSGKFRVERVLGQGGMGIVVAAKHLQLDEMVALKFLRAHATNDPEALARFMREARAAARMKSEHVARVLDVGVTDEGTPYIVMGYLEGRTLGRVIEDVGRLDVPTATEYVVQACEGLAEAHARGIVHRDVKPENLFLVERSQDWRVIKILDFGISKVSVARDETSNIATQNMMGSPCYMSPEQLRSTANVDHRTDIWSLGATLFELLAGATAYRSDQPLPQLIAAILERPAPALADLWPDVPAELSGVVARCLSKDRETRFASVAELALALLPFAPKRARAHAERAVSVTLGGVESGGIVDSRSTQHATPPSASDSPASLVGTLKSATLSGKAAVSENLDTLDAPTGTPWEEQKPRTALRATAAVVAIGAVVFVGWGLGRVPARGPAEAATGTSGAALAPSVSAVMGSAVIPASEAAPASNASLDAGVARVAEPAAPAEKSAHATHAALVGGTGGASGAAGTNGTSRPNGAPVGPATVPPAPVGTAAAHASARPATPANLDIRMER
jgi:eukaryotic-like serine/threonine-protein kinase